MKREYANIIFKASDYANKVPQLNTMGATLTGSVFYKAYDDFSYTSIRLNLIIQSIQRIESLEKTIKKVKHDPDMDVDGLKYSIKLERERMDQAMKELVEFVEERLKRNWN